MNIETEANSSYRERTGRWRLLYESSQHSCRSHKTSGKHNIIHGPQLARDSREKLYHSDATASPWEGVRRWSSKNMRCSNEYASAAGSSEFVLRKTTPSDQIWREINVLRKPPARAGWLLPKREIDIPWRGAYQARRRKLNADPRCFHQENVVGHRFGYELNR